MTFTTLGTIGAGPAAQAVALRAVKSGHRVVLSNSRSPGTLDEVVAGIGAGTRAGTFEDAISADLVLLAVPFGAVPRVGQRLDNWNGRIVVDMTNQFAEANPYRSFADVAPLTGSEWVARQLPGVTLLKAFNAMFAKYVAAEPHHPDGDQAVFFAGDNEPSKDGFAGLLTDFGFAPVDLGGLREGGALMQLHGALNGKHFLFQH